MASCISVEILNCYPIVVACKEHSEADFCTSCFLPNFIKMEMVGFDVNVLGFSYFRYLFIKVPLVPWLAGLLGMEASPKRTDNSRVLGRDSLFWNGIFNRSSCSIRLNSEYVRMRNTSLQLLVDAVELIQSSGLPSKTSEEAQTMN